MKRMFAVLISVLMTVACCTGCVCRVKSMRTDSRHFFKHTPEEIALLTEGLRRQAEYVIAEIKGPLRKEITAYFHRQVMELGPLVYQTRAFAEHQLEQIPILTDQIVTFLIRHVYDEYKILALQVKTYAEGELAEITPLHESFRRYIQVQYDHLGQFASAFKRYQKVNLAQMEDLGLSVKKYFRWQYENSKELPESVKKYVRKMSDDFEEVMNSSGRYMAFHLHNKPVELADSAIRYARYNMDELIPRLKKSTGRYFWRQAAEIPEITRELYCFTNRNLEETEVMIGNIQKYFAFNIKKTKELRESVHRFVEWRMKQWHMMKQEMDRFISFNIGKLDMLAESPVRYIQHQKEEWERLKEVVPQYFLFNISKGEGLAFAIKRYIRYNIEPHSGNCHR